MFIVPKVLEAKADPDEIASLDRKIKECAKEMRELIEKRDRLMSNYELRPIQLGEVI